MEKNKSSNPVMKILRNLDEIIAAVALTSIVVFVSINVVCRYMLGYIFNWMEELATMSFVWCTYMGIAAAYRTDDHVGINVIVNLLPKKIQFFIQLVVDIMVFVLNCVIFYLSIKLCTSSWTKSTPIMGVPYTFVNVSLTIGFFLMIFYSLIKIVKLIKNGPDAVKN